MIIRKIVSIFLFLLTLFVFSACDNTDTDNEGCTNKDDLTDDLISDTQTDTNDNIDSNVGSNSDDAADGLQNTTSDSQNNSEDLQPDTEIKEKIDTFGNFTTLHKTLASNDRMKQIKYSILENMKYFIKIFHHILMTN